MDLKRGVDMAVDAVVKDIEKRSKKVSTNDEIAQVSTAVENQATWRRDSGPVRHRVF
jgi:chaperonin GroEL